MTIIALILDLFGVSVTAGWYIGFILLDTWWANSKSNENNQ